MPALLLATSLGGASALAGQHEPAAREEAAQVREVPQPTKGITMDQAIEMAERRHKARVVRAEEVASKGKRVYVLRLLSEEGRVWSLKVDAQTGGELK
jgi:uncharacterized membrane protein YkoI